MLEQLHLKNFAALSSLPDLRDRGVFSLKTCQRHLMIALGEIEIPSPNISGAGRPDEEVECRGQEAYHYLLEVVCGIQSRVLAESEIVGQFKQAYGQYLQSPKRQRELIQILEKLLKDAKQIRSHYLEGVGQKTYAAITRKLVFEQAIPKRILIMGTGGLAQDVVNQFKKRVEQIFVSSRNGQKLHEFCERHLAYPLKWEDEALYQEFAFIVNTIGQEGFVLFNRGFFRRWQALHHDPSLFIDLGHPSSIETELGSTQGVIDLDHIFRQSAICEEEKRQKIQQAKQAIRAMSKRRGRYLLNQKQGAAFV